MDITELVQKIKAEQTIIRQPKRVRRKAREGPRRETKARMSPEAYARKTERDKNTWRGVSGAWKILRKTYRNRAKARGEATKWLITLEEWWKLWEAAGSIATFSGERVTIFSRRGPYTQDAKVYRINPEGDWTLDNMIVLYKGEIVANGRKISKENPTRQDRGAET